MGLPLKTILLPDLELKEYNWYARYNEQMFFYTITFSIFVKLGVVPHRIVVIVRKIPFDLLITILICLNNIIRQGSFHAVLVTWVPFFTPFRDPLTCTWAQLWCAKFCCHHRWCHDQRVLEHCGAATNKSLLVAGSCYVSPEIYMGNTEYERIIAHRIPQLYKVPWHGHP